jgi:hypothetical protein
MTGPRNSQREQSSSGWWSKFCNRVRNAKLDCIFRREPKIIVVKVRPLFLGHSEMFPENGLGVLVEQNSTLCEGFYRLTTLSDFGVWGHTPPLSGPKQQLTISRAVL